jgi:hypothetical protein
MKKLVVGKREREEEEHTIDNETHRVNMSLGQEAEPLENMFDDRNEDKSDDEKNLELPVEDGKEHAGAAGT